MGRINFSKSWFSGLIGHNDGGSPASSDRACVGGEGNQTQTVTLSDGTSETVYTWPT